MVATNALIVAAGSGTRAQNGGEPPKQYRPLSGKPVLRWALEAFARHPAIGETRVVIREQDRALYTQAASGLALPDPIIGGDTRQASVRNGLSAWVGTAPRNVLIHDGARPFVSSALITRIIEALETSDAAAPLIAVPDTLRRKQGGVFVLVPRDGIMRTQTPQGFRFDTIYAAHSKAGADVTDDIALIEKMGGTFTGVAGEEANIKLTTPEDFDHAARLASGAFGDTRTGSGFDVHRFTSGDHIWLCGIKIPHEFGLEGHSDADAGLHALTDAILGALGAGDIGMHFPPTDERWRGAPSHVFLEHAAKLAQEAGAVISHSDVTLICERPKVGPHRDAMRARIADILALDIARVSVKATTTEGLGFTGRREGIAAQALATLRFPL